MLGINFKKTLLVVISVMLANFSVYAQLFLNTALSTCDTAMNCDIVNYTTRNGPNSVSGADFDRDGDIDLVVACPGDDSVCILWNDGFGHFDSIRCYVAWTDPWAVIAFSCVGDTLPVFAVDLAH